jgi:hypothetical protein
MLAAPRARLVPESNSSPCRKGVIGMTRSSLPQGRKRDWSSASSRPRRLYFCNQDIAHTDRTAWLTMQSAANQSPQANSLLTGKITGNFAETGHPPRFSCLLNARSQWLAAEFPTQRNREFRNAYQGKFFQDQGISTYESPTSRGSNFRTDKARACPL